MSWVCLICGAGYVFWDQRQTHVREAHRWMGVSRTRVRLIQVLCLAITTPCVPWYARGDGDPDDL